MDSVDVLIVLRDHLVVFLPIDVAELCNDFVNSAVAPVVRLEDVTVGHLQTEEVGQALGVVLGVVAEQIQDLLPASPSRAAESVSARVPGSTPWKAGLVWRQAGASRASFSD